jgi:hypothetical protein
VGYAVANPPYSATVKRQADVRGYNGQRVKKEINLINSHNEGTAILIKTGKLVNFTHNDDLFFV